MKKNLIFTLGGPTLENFKGPRYTEAKGLENALVEFGESAFIVDYLQHIEPDEFDHIWIAPRSLEMFKHKNSYEKLIESHMIFLDKVRKSEVPVTLFFGDVDLKMDDLGLNGEDYMKDINFDIMVDYEVHDDDLVKSIFMGPIQSKKVTKVHYVNWVTMTHLPVIKNLANNSVHITSKLEFDGLYYGSFKDYLVEPLKELGISDKDLIVGGEKWKKDFPEIEVRRKVPISTLGHLIYQANKLYLPNSKFESGKQISSKLIEVLFLKNEDSEIVFGSDWNKISSILNKDMINKIEEKAINDFYREFILN